MMHLEDYLVSIQINNIEDILYSEQIDEGKVKDTIKKVWNFITGKNKKKNNKSSKQSKSSSVNISNTVSNSTDNKTSNKNKIVKLTWNELRDSIKINDKLARAKSRASKQNVEIKGIKDNDEIVALMAYMSRSNIEGYQDCPYILAIQVDEKNVGKGYVKLLVNEIYDLCKANGQKYILVSNKEYDSKNYWKNNVWDGTIEDPNDKDKAKAHYGEPGKIVNSLKD